MKAWQVLAIGGALIVVVMVIMKASIPKAKPVNSSFPLPSSAISGLAAGIGGFFAGLGSQQTTSIAGPINASPYNNPTAQTVLNNFDSDNSSVSNGFMFTDANGNFIAG